MTRVRDFVAGTRRPPNIAGADLGEVELVALFSRVSDLSGASEAEGVAYYGRGSLVEVQKRNSQEASRLLKERQEDVLDLRTTNGGKPTDDAAPIAELAASNAWTRHQSEQAALRTKREEQGAAAELGQHLLAGTIRGRSPISGLGSHKPSVLVYVGKGSQVRSGGGTGPRSGPAIIRQLETELRRHRVRYLFVRTNEMWTSSVCPSAYCLDDKDQRNWYVADEHLRRQELSRN